MVGAHSCFGPFNYTKNTSFALPILFYVCLVSKDRLCGLNDFSCAKKRFRSRLRRETNSRKRERERGGGEKMNARELTAHLRVSRAYEGKEVRNTLFARQRQVRNSL